MLKSYISQTGVNMNKINWKLESVKVYELSNQGSTLKEIGDIYGVTSARIRPV